ncbi:hypothetical protein D3C72_1988410 [compost metagenome]
MPKIWKRAFIDVDWTAARTSCSSRASTAGGTFAGASIAAQPTGLYSGCAKPDSDMVGTFGSSAGRRSPSTASGRRRPFWMCGAITPTVPIAQSSWPPIRSWTIGASPLYATCVMSSRFDSLKYEPIRCAADPTPYEP